MHTENNSPQDSAHCTVNFSLSITACSDVATNEQNRLDFAKYFLIRYDKDKSWPTICTNVAHFFLIGHVNFKNFVSQADKNSQDVIPVPLCKDKMSAQYGFANTFILGSYFFKEVTSTGTKTCSITYAR